MKFDISDNNTIKEFAQIALSEKLYVEGFNLKVVLNKIIKLKTTNYFKNSKIIFLRDEKNEILGMSAFFEREYISIQTFVKKENRNKGYGKILVSQLISVLSEKVKSKISFGLGDPNSIFFLLNMVESGMIDIELIRDEGQKNMLMTLKNYIICKKNKIDREIFFPRLKDLFTKEDFVEVQKFLKKI